MKDPVRKGKKNIVWKNKNTFYENMQSDSFICPL